MATATAVDKMTSFLYPIIISVATEIGHWPSITLSVVKTT